MEMAADTHGTTRYESRVATAIRHEVQGIVRAMP